MKDKVAGKDKYLKRVKITKHGGKTKRKFAFDPLKDRSRILTLEDCSRFDTERKTRKMEKESKDGE